MLTSGAKLYTRQYYWFPMIAHLMLIAKMSKQKISIFFTPDDATEKSKKHYLPLDGMINIPIYLVLGCWVQLHTTHFFFFADNIIFNNGYMKHAHTRQRMTNNNNNKRKQV